MSPRVDPPPVHRRLSRLYILALSAVAALSIGGQIITQFAIARQASDSRVVNLAGRQRMLSQKVSKLALLLAAEPDAAQRQARSRELAKALALWQQSHAGLRQGDAQQGLPGENSGQVEEMFTEVEPHFQAMVEGAETLVRCAAKDPTPECRAAARTVLAHEGPFLSGMDRIVFQYDAEARSRVALLRSIEMVLLTVTLVVLVLEGLFIFRPAVRNIRDTLARLRSAGRKLSVAKEAAEAASIAKSRFLATMTHEIRTPLAGVIGLAELSLEGPLEPETRRQLQAARDSARQLLRLLDEVLDYSKVEAGKLELDPRPLLLRSWLAAWQTPWEVQARTKGLLFACRVDDSVPDGLVVDGLRLGQILANLTANSIKFTERGSVTLEVTQIASEPSRARLAFAVRDTGIGIPSAEHARVFELFTQADNTTTRKYGGTGLGLAIAARLAELMQGQIALASREGEGSTFTLTGWFDLSTDEAQAAAPPDTLPVEQPLRPLAILLAEDSPPNQLVVSTMLEKQGHTVTCVDTGSAAVECCRRARFDAVLLDVEMPVMDGYTAAAAIRGLEEELGRPRVPILALTAHAGAEDRARSLAAGMDEHLSKPVSRAALLAALARLTQGTMSPASSDTVASPPARPVPTGAPPDPDLATAWDRLERNERLWNDLCFLFRRDSSSAMEELAQALVEEQKQQAQLIAHRLEGQLGNFEARAAVETAARLAGAVAEGDYAAAGARHAELAAEIRRLDETLRDWRASETL